MKYLYSLQTLLVLVLLSLSLGTYGQFADPLIINVRNSGSSFTDQFAASTDYTWDIIQEPSSQIGSASLLEGASPNTLKLTFYPNTGATGTTDVIISFYSLSAPMHPVTKWYRFNVADEVVVTSNDHFVMDIGSITQPLDVLANDSVTSGQLLLNTVSVSNAGEAVINSTHDTIHFTPAPDFEGETWIQYIACDSFGNCGEGNIQILVRDPNVQDHLVYNKFLLNTENLSLLTPFDSFSVDIEPAHGSLEANGLANWSYTPEEGYVGKDTFQLGLQGLVTRKYIVDVFEKALNIHARNDKFYVRPGLSVTFNVLNNDLLEYDVNSHTDPTKGVLNEIGNGVFTYTPIVGFRGVDKFTYTTCFQDTVYCETATVYIHVTDLEPDNQFSYKLQTSTDLPLAIDYPIEFTDFSYIISQEPAHGTLTYYAGVQQINLPCDTFDGYNMMVYQPEPGYEGSDHFEYYYCIQPSNLCYLVKVDMDVIEHPETENCPCTVGCVWPADGNRDGRVDMSDLLVLGNHLGDVGPARDYNNSETWFGQHAGDWQEDGDTGIQYIDANGDGLLTKDDVGLIDDYYYKTNDIVAKDVQQKLPYQFSIIPVQYSLDSGDVVILDIAFGNANHPVIDLTGAKFSLNIPEYMLDSASVDVQFHQDSWLAEGAPFISLGKVPWDGRIDAGFARAKGDGASGFGVIATVVFIIEDDVEGFKTNNGIIQIPIKLEAGTIMDYTGTLFDVDGDEIVLEYKLGTNATKFDLILYPNPATDLVNVHLNGRTAIESILVVDPQGRVVTSFDNIDRKNFQFDTDGLAQGLYYLQVKHQHGLITKPLSVIR